MTKKKSKTKRIVIIIIAAVVVLLAVLAYTGMQKRMAEAGKTIYNITDVMRGSVEVKVKGAGTVEPLEDNTVYAGFSGKVQQVLAEDGDVVSADDVIAVFESDALDSERKSLEQQIDDIDAAIQMLRGTSGSDRIYSPVKGVIKALYAAEGDSVDAVTEKYGSLGVICPDERMKTQISAEGLQLGDSVTVTADADSLPGIVRSIKDGQATISFEDDELLPGAAVKVSAADGSLLAEGTAQIENPVYITGRGGIVDEVRKDVGDDVSRGSRIYALEGEILSAELYTQIENRADLEDDLDDVLADIEALTVRAGKDGVISDLNLNEKQTVQEGAALFRIQSAESVKIDVDIDELDIAGIEVGEKASVTFDALPGQEYEAEIVKINPIGVAENNVTDYTVTLSMTKAQGMMIGMSADVEIISQHADDVLVIPAEAIQIINGEKFVVLESDIGKEKDAVAATHKVTTGITDGVVIEIREGLAQGDRIAVPQVKESTQQQMMDFRNNADNNGPPKEKPDDRTP